MSRGEQFLLMNKDIIVLVFFIERDIFSINYVTEHIETRSLLPRDLRDLCRWIEGRYICIYRYGMQSFLEAAGISRIEELIEITNCISLKDTYWVKKSNSKKTWNTVSPYRNPLDESIIDYSLTGKLTEKITTGSPDFATDGKFPKFWKRHPPSLYLYKSGITSPRSTGNEPYSELYAYEIATRLGIEAVKYELTFYRGHLFSKCKCLTNEKIGLMSYRDLHNTITCDFAELLQSVEGKEKKQIIDMLLLDYITCNVDRHYGNIGVFIENDTNRILDFTSLYDHNLSCLPYYKENEDLDSYISNLRVKDGRTWGELYSLIDSEYVREKLQCLLENPLEMGEKRSFIVDKMIRYQAKIVQSKKYN